MDAETQVATAQPCMWCGKLYEEHAVSREPGEPVPKMPCLGLRSGYRAASQPLATGLERISPSEPDPWEYRRPGMAGFYWWQEDEHSAPVIVEFKAEGHPGDFVHRWSAHVLSSGRSVPLARGRWRWINPPSAFMEWKLRP